MDDVNELKEQVQELEDRIYVLERKEASRKVGHLVKLLIYLVIIGGL